MSDEPDRRVDDLREQLRALGYLEARVDRFVLGGAQARRPAAILALTASTRIGALAGVLLGPAAAVGLRLRAPDLVTNTSDALIVALYLGVLFGIAAALTAVLAILAGGALAARSATHPHFSRRAARAAAGAGFVVGLACLIYLTLWWRTATGIAGVDSAVWTIAVVGVAVAISLLLGHVVTVTVLAWLARAGFGAALRPRRPWSSPGRLAALAAVAFVGAATLLIFSATNARTPTTSPSLTVVPTGQQVLVVAIDGIDLTILDRLQRAGRLPVLGGWLSGAVARLASDRERDPARVWTTIATGQPAERHGIRALESREVAGLEGRLRGTSGMWSTLARASDLLRLTRPIIASGDDRLIPAFWEVAARAGLRTAVVQWWATWPATDDGGIVVSDRAILRLERGGALAGEIAPAGLYDAWQPTWSARRARIDARVALQTPPTTSPELAATLVRSATLDGTVLDMARDEGLGDPDLLTLYLPGLDIAQHALFATSVDAPMDATRAAERVACLEWYYVFLDAALADLSTRHADARHTVMLIAQPGRVERPSDGLLAVRGALASRVQGSAAATSVASTVLHALGVPIARDLPTPPALDLFSTAFLGAHPIRDVSTYGTRSASTRAKTGQPLDREMIDRMRSLGYVR